jgi:hypothetical protein
VGRLKITAGTEVVAVAAGTAAGEIETRTQAREAIGTIGEAAIGTGTGGTGKIGTGTGKIGTGTEEIGTIGIGEMSSLAAEGETTIAISTKTGESEGASRNRVARIPEIGRRERCCRKEKKDVVVSETAAMGIGDTRIEEKIDEEEANRANRWDRVARIPATGRNERASERTIDTNPFASVRD